MMNGHFAGAGNGATKEQYMHGVQVIDSDQNYNPNLPTYLNLEKVTPAGFNYHLISVFGSQSTGKSTLLNYLFGTDFGVMSEDDRRQTTKGIWLSKNKKEDARGGSKAMAENILVMDVEGTDGRERGEDQDFERKAALFALATSEVLIVNIWEHQVGLYQGANMALLKTVFEVNLELFLKDRKSVERSLLFFVIRDHIGNTPLENLRKTLLQDLSSIWSSLSKPKGMENAKIEDYFDFTFVALPHKILQPEKFESEVAKLGTRFREGKKGQSRSALREDISEGIFLPEYHRRIPADGFSHYAEGVWDQIVNNKDLDLPTQQELLAQFRCDEIAREAFVAFDEVIEPFEKMQQESVRAGKPSLLPELGGALKASRLRIMADFDEEAGRYHKGVYQRKREELLANVDARLKALLIGQLDAAHKSGVTTFSDSISDQVRQAQKKGATYDFAEIVVVEKKKALARFEKEGRDLIIEGATWSDFKPYLARYQKDLDEVSAKLRKDEMRRLATRVERMVRSRLNEKVGMEFNSIGAGRVQSNAQAEGDKSSGERDIWDRIWKVFTETVQYAEARFTDRAKGLDASPDEIEVGLWRLRRKSWTALKAKIEEEVLEGNILMKLRENFEDRFRYDAEGVPRIWRPTDDIEGVYTKARDETLTLIPLLSHFRLNATSEPPLLEDWIGAAPPTVTAADEEDLSSIGGIDADDGKTSEDEMTILSDSKASDLTTRFKKTADGVYVEAKRSAVGGITQVPVWFYGLLLLLGWNELMALLRNPLYFVFLGILGAGAYVTYSLNLWGPMIRMADAATKQAVDIGKEKLRDFLEAQEGSQGGRRSMAMASGSEEYEMKSQRRRRRKPEADDDDDAGDDI